MASGKLARHRAATGVGIGTVGLSIFGRNFDPEWFVSEEREREYGIWPRNGKIAV